MHHADSNTLLVRKKKKTRLERTCSAKESNPPKHWTRTEEQQENNTEEKYIAELSYSRCIEELKMNVIECFKRNRGRDGGGARVGSEEQGTFKMRDHGKYLAVDEREHALKFEVVSGAQANVMTVAALVTEKAIVPEQAERPEFVNK
jgi:hypothetical protein